MEQEKRLREIFCRNLNRLFLESEKQKKELAAFVGVSDNTVTSWVKGRKVPRMDKIDMICSFFGVSRSSIITEKSVNTVLPPQPTLSKEEIEMIMQYRALDERGKSAVNDTLNREYSYAKGEC